MFVLVWFSGVLHHILNAHMLAAYPSAFHGSEGILSYQSLLSVHQPLAQVIQIHLHWIIAKFGTLYGLGD